MSKDYLSERFSSMNVAGLKKYLQERGITVHGYLKPALVTIACAVEKMMLPVDPNFERDDTEKNLKKRLIVHDVAVQDPFTLPVRNNFINSPPFGLYDIFNHLIYHSADYDKQGLASYKSYDDYRLFDDGYVESLSITYLKECGVHVYVSKVNPTMRMKTDEGKEYYELWFILEGKGPNRGSVLEAFCKCTGGRDGGCKHIAAAMYSLEFLLNTEGKDSVTSGECLWKRRQQSNVKPCEVKDVNISKCEYGEPSKKKRPNYVWLQNIDHDPREEKFRKERSHDDMVRFTKAMKKQVVSKIKDTTNGPAIFPLLRKLYLPDDVPKATTLNEMMMPKSAVGIMEKKEKEFIQENTSTACSAEEFLRYLSFTGSEIADVESATIYQSENEQWFLHKAGFISASNCKAVFTRQTSLDKEFSKETTALAKSIVSKKCLLDRSNKSECEPNNPRDWGLSKEKEARKCYTDVARKQHNKFRLEYKGFQISKKPFLGVSVDNIRRCKCTPDCGVAIVEYKCPWVHRDNDAKKAFVSKEIGGIYTGHSYYLQKSSKYFYQVQMQLYVFGAKICDFVVCTAKGIHVVPVPFEPSFMHSVCVNLEKFWVTQVVPLLLEACKQHVPCAGSVQFSGM